MSKFLPGIDYFGIAVNFCCIDGQGKVLLAKRSQNCRDEQGKWEFGSGQLEFGEQPSEGALREVHEEFSCNGKIIAQIPAYTLVREKKGIKSSWLLIPFIIQVNPEEVSIGEPNAIDELKWVTFNSLPTPLHSAAGQSAKLYQEVLQTKKTF